jgi:HD-GYP domain-containing protein (c-di-GMP phosphodiesterase class II)
LSDTIKKSEGVKFDGEKLERARSYQEKLQELGRALVASLHMLVRNVKLYGPENSVFVKPLEKLQDTINTIIALDGKLNLQCAQTSFYLNDMLLRIDTKVIESLGYLNAEFERCDVGGFTLDKSVNIQELQNFIYIFGRENQTKAGEQGVPGRTLQALKLRHHQKIREILEHEQDATQLMDIRLDRKRYALVVYARVLHFYKKLVAGIRGQGPQIPPQAARNFIQDLVDVNFDYRSHFIGLTTLAGGSDRLAFHAANVAVLAVVFGIELGFSKEQLRELGMAALLHDLGKAELPDELLDKTSGWTPEELATLARVPRLTTRRLLGSGALTLENMHNIVAAVDHQALFGKAIRDLQGNVTMVEATTDLAVYPRVVAIVDGYATLTQQYNHSPEQALRLLNGEWKPRFDPFLLRFFGRMLRGLYTRILAEGGEHVELF